MRRFGWSFAVLASAALLVGVGTVSLAQEQVLDDASAVADPAIAAPIDLAAFAAAWSSGDADLVRAFYTDDARIFPIGVDEMGDGSLADDEPWTTGPDIDREVSQHAGGTYDIFDPVRVGNIATYTWRWDLGGMTITGADILHFKDDLIWRHFIDYQMGPWQAAR